MTTNDLVEKLSGCRVFSRSGLLSVLAGMVSKSELDDLKRGTEDFEISAHNRRTIFRMVSNSESNDSICGSVMTQDITEMVRNLQAYLNEYMGGSPNAHKWIILSCVFLYAIAQEPLHPKEIVNWGMEAGEYICPMRDDAKGSICRWCICRRPT